MSTKEPFFPQYGKTQAATSAAGAVNLTFTSIPGRQLLLTNVGTVLVFVRVKPNGDSSDASAADMPLPAGTQRIITRDPGNPSNASQQTIVSVFASGAGSTVYVTPGDGFGP